MKIALAWLLAMLAASTVFAEPIPIQFGEHRSVSLCSNTQTYAIAANPGDRIAIFSTELQDYGGSCTPGCCCFDQRLRVEDASSVLLAEKFYIQGNACGALYKLSLQEVHLAAGGSYTISIGDGNSSGGGTIVLVAQRVNQPGLVEDSLATGSDFLKDLPAGNVHTYTLTAASGDSVRVTMTPEGSSLQPTLAAYNPDGRLLKMSGNGEDVLRFVATSAGRHTVLAYSTAYESGLYRISMNSVPTPVVPMTWGGIKVLYR